MDESLLKRIEALETRDALNALVNRYHWVSDTFDWIGYADCFAEDAEYDSVFGVVSGKKAIYEKMTEQLNNSFAWHSTQHLIANFEYEMTGPGTAKGHSNMTYAAVADPKRPFEPYLAGGRYHWEFRKTDKGWLISRLRYEFLWSSGATPQVFSKSKMADTKKAGK